MRKCANISPYMRRPLVIYDFATAPFWISLYMNKIWFSFFISVLCCCWAGFCEYRDPNIILLHATQNHTPGRKWGQSNIESSERETLLAPTAKHNRDGRQIECWSFLDISVCRDIRFETNISEYEANFYSLRRETCFTCLFCIEANKRILRAKRIQTEPNIPLSAIILFFASKRIFWNKMKQIFSKKRILLRP